MKNRADAVGGLLAINKTTKQQNNQTTSFLVKNRADAVEDFSLVKSEEWQWARKKIVLFFQTKPCCHTMHV